MVSIPLLPDVLRQEDRPRREVAILPARIVWVRVAMACKCIDTTTEYLGFRFHLKTRCKIM